MNDIRVTGSNDDSGSFEVINKGNGERLGWVYPDTTKNITPDKDGVYNVSWIADTSWTNETTVFATVDEAIRHLAKGGA
jgi:hypothetical protein